MNVKKDKAVNVVKSNKRLLTRKSFDEILILVDKELRENPKTNWNQMAKKFGCQWITIRKACSVLKVVRAPSWRDWQIWSLEQTEKLTKAKRQEMLKIYGLEEAREI